MRIQQRTEVLTENKVTRCQNNVRIIGILDCLHVVHIRIDIIAVEIIFIHAFCRQDVQLSTLGVNVVMTSGSQMLQHTLPKQISDEVAARTAADEAIRGELADDIAQEVLDLSLIHI